MTEIMCMLANDHRNMTKILDALQRQISSLDHAGPPNHHPCHPSVSGESLLTLEEGVCFKEFAQF